MKAWERFGLPLAAVAFGFSFYYFLAIPLILEYAYAGTLAVVALTAGLARALTRPHRLGMAALLMAFLLTLEAVDKLQDQPPAVRLGGIALLLVAYPLLARAAAGVSLPRTASAVIAAALLAQILTPSLYPALTGFSPRWVSPPLTAQEKIPFFTPVAADLNDNGRAEIAAVTSAGNRSAGNPPDAAALLTDRFVYQVFRWDGGRFAPVSPDTLTPRAKARLTSLVRNEHAGAPVLSTAWSSEPDGLPAFSFRPVADPFQAVAAAAPGRLPFAILGLTLRGVTSSHETWADLQRQAGDPAARPEMDPPASPREVAWIAAEADLAGDSLPERLINLPDRGAFIAGPAAMEPIWRAPNDTLRFAAFGPVGRQGGPVILAQDKGIYGFDLRRYLGGYRLVGDRLERVWKVFIPGVVHPALADVDGDGGNEIVAALWDTQQIIVLQRHPWPVTQAVWALTLAVILRPAFRRLRPGVGARSRRPATLASMGTAVAIVLSAGFFPSPALHLESGGPPTPLDAGASPDPEARSVLAEAVRRMEDIGRYSFQGETLTYVGKRRIPTSVGGTVGEERMRVHGAIWGDNYHAYQEGNRLYLGFETWHRQPVPASPPANLGATLAYLPELAGAAQRLPGTELIQRTRTRVYLLDADAAAVQGLIPAAFAPPPGFWDADQVPGRFRIKVWVGEEDGLIHQLQTFFDVPLAEATGLRQKTLIWFGNFNDQDMEIQVPEELSSPQAIIAP